MCPGNAFPFNFFPKKNVVFFFVNFIGVVILKCFIGEEHCVV